MNEHELPACPKCGATVRAVRTYDGVTNTFPCAHRVEVTISPELTLTFTEWSTA